MFKAVSTNSKLLTSCLQSILIKKDACAFVSLSRQGIKFVVEKDSCLVAEAFIPSAMFSEYECSQTIECGLPLSRVLDALQLLGTDASSKAKVILGSTTHQRTSLIPRRRPVHKLVTECAGVYQPFTVGLVDNGAVSSCGIRALESIPPSDCLSFDDAFCSNIIVDSSALADAITDIEWWGEEVSLSMSSNEPIQLETCCAYGRCSIRMNSSSDVFSRVSIHPSSPSCSYKVHLLKQFSKSLGLSNRTGITVSSKGLLRATVIASAGEGINCLVDFRIAPSV